MTTETKQKKEEKYDITYSKEALRTIDELTEYYNLNDRAETLNFALFTLKKLKEERVISLKR